MNIRIYLKNLFDIPTSFGEEQRRQRLLDILLLLFGIAGLITLVTALAILLAGKARYLEDSRAVIIFGLIALPSLVGLYFLNHSKASYLSRWVLVVLLLISALADTPDQIAGGRGLLNFSLSIIAAGILIYPSAGFILAFISSVLVEGIAHVSISQPQPFPAIVVFFLLAILIWMATRSTEQHIKYLAKVNTTLKESEERYRTLVEISPDMVVLTDLEGKIIVVNPAGLALFGFSDISQVRNHTIFEYIAPEDRLRAITEFGAMAKEGETAKAEYLAITCEGDTFYIEINASLIKDASNMPQGVLSIGRDITLRKKMQQAILDEKDEAYRALVNNSDQGLVLLEDGRIILANAAIASHIGLTIEELYELPPYKIFDFVHPDDREIGFIRMKERLEGKPVPASYETRLVHKNGTIYWLELRPTVLMLGETRVSQITAIDITERKRAESALQDSEERYRTLVDNSAQGLVLLQNGRIILANEAIANCIGLTVDELYALPEYKIFDFVPPGEREVGLERNRDRLLGRPVPNRYETRLIHKNGTIHWLELMPTVITLNGIPTIQVTAIEITERKKAEEALQAAHNKLEATLNTLPDYLFELDREQHFCDFRAVKETSFFPAHEALLGKTVKEVMPAETASVISAALDEARVKGQHRGATYDVAMNDGVYSFELSISTLGDMEQPSGRFIMLVRDITERKRAENALRLSEKKYRRLHDGMRDGFVYKSLDGRILEYNESYRQMLGYSSEELSKLTYLDITPEKWHAFEQDIMEKQILKKGYSDIYEKEYRKKDGTTFPVELRTFIVKDEMGRNEGMWAIVRDITRRKRGEAALKESEERYRTLAETAQDMIFIVDSEDRIKYINRYASQLVGLKPDEMIGLPRSQFFPANISDQQREEIRQKLKRGKPVFVENTTTFPSGETWVSTWLVPLNDEFGRAKSVLGISRDISERKRAEEALRKSEERYRSLAETAQDIIVIIDLNDRLEYVNKFAAQLVHMSPKEMLGLPRSQFFPSDMNDRHQQNLQKVAEKGLPMFTESLTKFSMGKEMWLSNWLVPLKDETGAVREIMAISRNITEHKALEASLLEAKNTLEKRVEERTADLIKSHEQMRQLTRRTVLAQENERRRLSRELHDEAGQALISVMFNLDEILAEMPEDHKNLHDKIMRALARTDTLNQHIRALAHGLRPPILDVAGINLALNGFCRDFAKETHFPVTYSGTDNLPALSEEISITLYRIVQEAITNVVKHAHASEAHVNLSYQDNYVIVTINDNGAGFDTKKTSKGVGLLGMEERLSLLGGKLEIVSRRKQGTRVKATIPCGSEGIQ